ncbi:uncharacterized protein JOF56_006674 [Kibdelosporangium banguiense]|uniref:Radical SAM core domain-containing protein n=2 Tax=Kibdelosporangium banguiense TaxID=1365924 RepID=A0ABS4TQN7_9PSEU|nr:uncharacterized protein [Kibdelosporangium banguiense]
MSREVMDAVAQRIGEHVRTHRQAAVDVVLHGGEPLLAGHDKIEHLLAAVHRAVGSSARIRFVVQTNAVLIDDRYLRLFAEWDTRIGVSLDGDAAAHDRHRRSLAGAGTYQAVAGSLRKITAGPFRSLFGGLLCTVDVRNDPLATYTGLLEFSPPMVDFLLPHGNWSNPPPFRAADSTATPYADWLIAIFDRWYGAPEQETRIRLFESIIDLLLGGRSSVEGVGLEIPRMMVIETDGTIERADVLATAYEGAAATGLHVVRDSFDAALRLSGPSAEPAHSCRRCDVYRTCGGGLLAHRYRRGEGFGNPSVYCLDLRRLIRHIQARLTADLAGMAAR